MILLNQFGHTVIDTNEANEDDVTWTEEELAELLKPQKPLTGKEMVEGGFIGGWEHKQIDDPLRVIPAGGDDQLEY